MNKIINADALEAMRTLPDSCCRTCITSPPYYGLRDYGTAEVLRVCVLEGKPNANSMLYGAAARACKAMGYKSVITYTLPEESGASLRAAGFVVEGKAQKRANGWDTPARRRSLPEKYPEGEKIRWRISWKGAKP